MIDSKNHWTKHTTPADDALALQAVVRVVLSAITTTIVIVFLVAANNLDATIKVWLIFSALFFANLVDAVYSVWRMRRNAKKRMNQ